MSSYVYPIGDGEFRTGHRSDNNKENDEKDKEKEKKSVSLKDDGSKKQDSVWSKPKYDEKKYGNYIDSLLGKEKNVNKTDIDISYGKVENKDIISQQSLDIIRDAATNIGAKSIKITETIRSPRGQAEAMFNNLERGVNIKYKPPGENVKAHYRDLKEKGYSDSSILDSMENRIIKLGDTGERVSKHCVSEETYNKLNVIDISYQNIDKTAMIKELLKNERVVKVIHNDTSIPNQSDRVVFDKYEPCIHIEIKQ